MPYIDTYVEPEILFMYEGVPICVAYDECQANDPHNYLYTIGMDEHDNDNRFDVRELSQFGADKHKPIPAYARDREYHLNVIREAISHGELDYLFEEIGLIAGLGAWPQNMDDLNANQALTLMRSYSNYIQIANEENKYQSGWMPVSIGEYYGAEFEQELRDAKDIRNDLAIGVFASQLEELKEGK